MEFKIESKYAPSAGQAEAINKLFEGYRKHSRQTLLGITGSGKTFVMAHLIEKIQKPTLVIAHNKTLAAQLYTELKELFPRNKVEYFISYYDYYQPESYLPTTDTYIEKEATINLQIEKMRLHSVASLLSRDDVIVVASISCIYGIGDPGDFKELSVNVKAADEITRSKLIERLIEMQYERSDNYIEPGKFRVRGETIDIIPAYDDNIVRIELSDGKVDKISEVNALTGEMILQLSEALIFPAKQFVVPESKQQRALAQIEAELKEHAPTLPLLESQRLVKRVKYDIEMIREMGYCSGIENYSRHFDGRAIGEPPSVLLDYFPDDFLLILDESHQTIPQAHAMYKGDYSRKKSLVDFGFRLPCAYDNRPLKFEEFEKYFRHAVFVSATPGPYELSEAGQIVELIVRPTGLLDPEIEVRPIKNQIADMILEIRARTAKNERVLITTLTKKMAENLTDYIAGEDIKVRYLHSDIESLDRIELIRQLRSGEFDVLVGINLLREGLDLPEVSLVCILDADKEGFLRNERSLIQTIGRAARNLNGKVILYADIITDSIRKAVAITKSRRARQAEYNKRMGITPMPVIKTAASKDQMRTIKGTKHLSSVDIERQLIELEAQMKRAAENLDFENAIRFRDALEEMKSARDR